MGGRGLWGSASTDPERLLGDTVLHTFQHVHVGMWQELRRMGSRAGVASSLRPGR